MCVCFREKEREDGGERGVKMLLHVPLDWRRFCSFVYSNGAWDYQVLLVLLMNHHILEKGRRGTAEAWRGKTAPLVIHTARQSRPV